MFSSLTPAAQEAIRAKQRQRKASKKLRKKRHVPSTSRSDAHPDPPKDNTFPRSISKEAYFAACPYGVFRTELLTARVSSVDLLMDLLRRDVPLGDDCRLSQFNYFLFAGSEDECWAAELYAKLAFEGFFTITYEGLPLPELQPFYSIVRWPHFNAASTVKRALKRLRSAPRYRLFHARDPRGLYAALDAYQQRRHGSNWLTLRYFNTMIEADRRQDLNFEMHTFELYEEQEKAVGKEEQDAQGLRLVAGEIGYSIGKIYTSLSGWSDREINGVGYVQLACLGVWLQKKGFAFWSLGHCYCPEMEYKMRIGHRVYPRKEFLKIVEQHRGPFRIPGGGQDAERRFRDKEECDIQSILS